MTNKRNEILSSYGKPKPQEGIYELLKEIKKLNLKIFVVTGSSKTNIKEEIIEDFKGYITKENIISGLDVNIGKPSPEPYLLALHMAQVKPTEVIAIENAPLGIKSAKSSGIYTIAVNTGVLEDKELKIAGADNIFKSCFELSEKWNEINMYLNQ